jgi:hypothetical protein
MNDSINTQIQNLKDYVFNFISFIKVVEDTIKFQISNYEYFCFRY